MRATAQATAGGASPLPEESPLVKDLRRRLQEVQRAHQDQLQVNAKQTRRLRELEEVLQQKVNLEKKFEELQKELSQAREEKEAMIEFGEYLLEEKDKERDQMLKKGRQMVNQYVEGLYQDNENLKRFSQEQQSLASKNQEKVKQLEQQLKLQKAKQTLL
ncbi:trichohyalin-like [Boleophthalmus pectinirostris]|uniref:trichohyalin-like n=1 Tax=Boleophthalmus pectinirostris TaxID=150288 RepID=UPI0024306B44|nr:trichohyalin-like [Boleophthalmus pectinirostris]